MTEKNKQKVKNRLYNWANYYKMIALQKTEITQLNAICREAQAARRMLPDSTNTACLNVIDACKTRIEQLDKTIQECRSEKELIDSIIDSLDYMEQIIIKQKYLHNKSWDCIIAYLPISLSTRQCYRIYNEILERIYQSLQELDVLKQPR